ncbi:MAG: antitoxin MazE-like protein [Pseudomonadota bacterium]
MTAPAKRMKMMRDRLRQQGLRELRLVLPDLRSSSVRRRVAAEIAVLSEADENDALIWIESVSEFDAPDNRTNNEAR